jgi:hypothetical protein
MMITNEPTCEKFRIDILIFTYLTKLFELRRQIVVNCGLKDCSRLILY